MYTAQLRQLACDALEGVDVFWNNPQGARDGQLDSVSCFGKMYVVPYPFHCVVVYDDANDEAIVRDECDEATPLTSHTNLAKLLSINFTPEVMAKRELRQKLRVLSHSKTPFTLPFTRQEKLFVGRKFRGLKWGSFLPLPSRGTTSLSASTRKASFVCDLAAIREGFRHFCLNFHGEEGQDVGLGTRQVENRGMAEDSATESGSKRKCTKYQGENSDET